MFRIQTGLFIRWATARFVPLGDAGPARRLDRARSTTSPTAVGPSPS